jgi:hypothetical protein
VPLRLAAIALLAFVVGCGDGRHTLYRNSVLDAAMRIHVATFDASEGASYNAANCDIARRLFQDQPGVTVAYWCEAGGYKK